MAYGYFYNYKIDVWSLGIIFFAMLFNLFPFGQQSSQIKQAETISKLCDPKFDIKRSIQFNDPKMKQKYQQVSKEICQLFEKMFVIKIDDRYSLKQLCDVSSQPFCGPPLAHSRATQIKKNNQPA